MTSPKPAQHSLVQEEGYHQDVDDHRFSELREQHGFRRVLYRDAGQDRRNWAAPHQSTKRFYLGRTQGAILPVTSSSRGVPKSKTERFAPQDWFWEGNVQSHMVKYLVLQGYRIRSVTNTLTRQQGIDIVAEKGGQTLWVTVKGYPRATERTRPSVQAPQWFKQAIFDIVDYRGRDKHVSLAAAFPDFARYRSLARRIAWLKGAAGFMYFWIRETDDTLVE